MKGEFTYGLMGVGNKESMNSDNNMERHFFVMQMEEQLKGNTEMEN